MRASGSCANLYVINLSMNASGIKLIHLLPRQYGTHHSYAAEFSAATRKIYRTDGCFYQPIITLIMTSCPHHQFFDVLWQGALRSNSLQERAISFCDSRRVQSIVNISVGPMNGMRLLHKMPSNSMRFPSLRLSRILSAIRDSPGAGKMYGMRGMMIVASKRGPP